MSRFTFFITIGLLTLFNAQNWRKPAHAFTFNVDNISATWKAPNTELDHLDSIFWGDPITPEFIRRIYPSLPTSLTVQQLSELYPEDQRPNLDPNGPIEERKSGLQFVGGNDQNKRLGEWFKLGELTHFNNLLQGGTGLNSVAATINLDITLDPGLPTTETVNRSFAFELGIEETPNGDTLKYENGVPKIEFSHNCKYVGRTSCPDRIFLDSFLSASSVEIRNAHYTLGWLPSSDPDRLVFEGGITNEGNVHTENFYVFGILVENNKKPPQVTIGSPLVVDEGELFTISALSDSNGLRYTWDLDGNDSSVYDPEDVGAEIFTIFAQDTFNEIKERHEPVPIHLRVSDINNGNVIGELTSWITVENVAPEITFLTESLSVLEGDLFQFSAEAFDPGTEDTLTFAWDLNNDGHFDDLLSSSEERSFLGEYSFSESGLFTIGLQVSDGDGGVSSPRFFNVQVESPSEAVPVPESSTQSGLLFLGLVGLGSLAKKHYKRLTRSDK